MLKIVLLLALITINLSFNPNFLFHDLTVPLDLNYQNKEKSLLITDASNFRVIPANEGGFYMSADVHYILKDTQEINEFFTIKAFYRTLPDTCDINLTTPDSYGIINKEHEFTFYQRRVNVQANLNAELFNSLLSKALKEHCLKNLAYANIKTKVQWLAFYSEIFYLGKIRIDTGYHYVEKVDIKFTRREGKEAEGYIVFKVISFLSVFHPVDGLLGDEHKFDLKMKFKYTQIDLTYNSIKFDKDVEIVSHSNKLIEKYHLDLFSKERGIYKTVEDYIGQFGDNGKLLFLD